MKVLLAGATGTLGRPLVATLRARGHEILAITRTTGTTVPGTQPVVADVLDRSALLNAVDGLHADVVIHELTALRKTPTHYRDMEQTNRLRISGTAHLLDAAVVLGARRFLTQSMVPGYGYVDHGSRPLTEDDPFGLLRNTRADAVVAAMLSTEQQVFAATGIEGIALRYGSFYGPGASDGMIEALRARKVPVVRGGGGTMSWIHVDDAATATVAAVERGQPDRAYNVVDDVPVSWGEMLTGHARAVGAPDPRPLPGFLIRLVAPYFGAIMLDTSLRVSNARAKAELGWTPRYPSYREGLATLVSSAR